MGIGIRHVVVVSGVLSAGAFVYVLGFSEMDEQVYRRAAAIDAGPSRFGMINSIRNDLTLGQLERASRVADRLVKHAQDDPIAHYYRAIVDEFMGEVGSGAASWERMILLLEDHGDGEQDGQMAYYLGWAKRGIGEIEESRAIFRQIADNLEIQAMDEDGNIANASSQYNLACYRSMSGEFGLAIEHWEQAVMLGFGLESGWWAVDPDLSGLRENPRFWAVVAGFGADDEAQRWPGMLDQDDD